MIQHLSIEREKYRIHLIILCLIADKILDKSMEYLKKSTRTPLNCWSHEKFISDYQNDTDMDKLMTKFLPPCYILAYEL